MRLKNIRNLFLLLALLSVVSLVSYKIGQNNSFLRTDGQSLELSLMWKVKNKLDELYLDKDKIDDDVMKYGIIEGMVASLDDPYTVFLPPKENKTSNEDLAGEFGGVGISLGYKDKTLSVMSPLPNSPAENAGLKAGDLILKIIDENKGVDKDTLGISLTEAVESIRGKIGTDVTLKIYTKDDDSPRDVVLTRANIVVPSLELEWKEVKGKRFAWVRLYKFTEKLFEEWPEMVEEIRKEKGFNFGGIVLDLRNNPGGYLQASVLVASDFIDKGVIVKQESNDGTTEEYRVVNYRGKLLNEKLVVLVNGGSASASEILAGALKEYGRAILVGEKTFGKGTVQQPEEFRDGSGLHITIAKWLLPSGENIHNNGVEADIEIEYVRDENEDGDSQLDKAIESLLE